MVPAISRCLSQAHTSPTLKPQDSGPETLPTTPEVHSAHTKLTTPHKLKHRGPQPRPHPDAAGAAFSPTNTSQQTKTQFFLFPINPRLPQPSDTQDPGRGPPLRSRGGGYMAGCAPQPHHRD